MFKNFCCCSAAISDLYDRKSKNCSHIFFPNSHGWVNMSGGAACCSSWTLYQLLKAVC